MDSVPFRVYRVHPNRFLVKKGACALRRAEREAETFVSRLDRNNVFIQNDSIQSASIHFIDFSF